MGLLLFVRGLKRALGLNADPEYPHFEALIEKEYDQPGTDYRIIGKYIPPITAVLVLGFPILVFFARGLAPLLSLAGVGLILVLAIGAWHLVNRLDKAIPRSKARIRELAAKIHERYSSFGNATGLQPMLSTGVGLMLEEASRIYLKHSNTAISSPELITEDYNKAVLALETAMARMLDLATPATRSEQDMVALSGWAEPLLGEMRKTDVALDQHILMARTARDIVGDDPLANLRATRFELEGEAKARAELEENQRG